ncbi:rRNA maturation RNase YbeY [Roseisalinus antarcticus]|uniref:Endoribonuclease YbeY n=1 Tax=Roseisalinus antarcticus TaxID=254357 RepID=A0A1Y5TUL6_9RHOB|nr:rRNA maturation RNase YbeY [Roseisalinus antarcticus]SLN70119.1 Endoribonuclease YbeY [Roseisalinus antarcticus]
MPVEINVEDESWSALDLQSIADGAADATLSRLGLEPSVWEISLLACDDARIAALNADFRGKPQPTNVLSWPSDERGAAVAGESPLPPDLADPELGDIAIAFDTCAAEARTMGKTLPAHATHLVVHAILHLLGYDHIRDPDALLMEGLENEILGKLGLADPYEET